jgi:dTDP-glucose 4,6-dehydratase
VRVLVTGAAGFVGSHVVEQLLALDCDVLAVGSLQHNGSSRRLLDAMIADPDRGEFSWLLHDLAAPFSDTQTKRLADVSVIVNVASLASVDASISDPAAFVRNNVNATLTVLELARSVGVERFIQVSTDEVYGTHVPCDDGHHAPSSPYSASKAAQEDLCNAWRETFNVPVSIVRSANMFGERQSELAFIPRVVRAVLNDEMVTIHVDAYGAPGIRNYSYVGNVAHYLAHRATTVDDAVYNTTLRGQCTLDNFSLALNVAAILDRELKYEFVDAISVRPGYDRKYELHGTDWNPRIAAGEALRRTVLSTAQRMGVDV